MSSIETLHVKADEKKHELRICGIPFVYRARVCRPEEQCAKCVLKNRYECCYIECDKDFTDEKQNIVITDWKVIK